jgi:serine protease Do
MQLRRADTMDEFSSFNLAQAHPPVQPGEPERAAIPSRNEDAANPPGGEEPHAELMRVRLAWAKLLWLLLFLAVLLSVTMAVPYVVTEVVYAANRGRLRAEHEAASQELKGEPLAQLSRGFQLITQKVRPSVVHIAALNRPADIMTMSSGMRGPLFESPSRGQGSGVIVDAKRGYILTNYHVVQGAREIRVRLADQKPVMAHLVGHDPDTDLAVLQIRREDLPNSGLIAAEWGDSDALEVGSFVLALGSPYGLEQTVTMGMVSAKHRANQVGNPLQDFLQTDVAINPGNSGGPLVDERGCIVGINTAIVGENYQGISFAVPSRVARQVYEKILSDSEHAVRRGYLGIRPDAMNEERARVAGLDAPRGVYVARIEPDSPAEKLPLREGDVILRWNGKEVSTPAELTHVVCDTPIGSQAKLVIWRDEQEMELTVTVGERPRPY